MFNIPYMIRIKIAELVKEKWISLYRFANDCGITYNQLYSIAKWKTKRVEFKTIEIFCEHLNCEPWDLFEYTKEK
ncbi:MAG: hypothetical protein ACD_71C00130G0010 [uncultured bacterium (gcode 4)]|uniref:HTH cro/C1-type domain-containing protein n=1 Tax=uncultured bacterium (gcode 4) TaxID=1234023 RepID=K1ZJ51_9BACT|nr:MAG: hypothetical protein ACD_71C00130G0010 [uncultured bacterium (gcode 4)]